MPSAATRFPRQRRLKRQRLIRPLFDPGRQDVSHVRQGPITLRYRWAPADEVGLAVPIQVGFAVSRSIGDRPARNRVKRLLRESFRANQASLLDAVSGRADVLTVMILYRGQIAQANRIIPEALTAAMRRLAAEISGATSSDRMNLPEDRNSPQHLR